MALRNYLDTFIKDFNHIDVDFSYSEHKESFHNGEETSPYLIYHFRYNTCNLTDFGVSNMGLIPSKVYEAFDDFKKQTIKKVREIKVDFRTELLNHDSQTNLKILDEYIAIFNEIEERIKPEKQKVIDFFTGELDFPKRSFYKSLVAGGKGNVLLKIYDFHLDTIQQIKKFLESLRQKVSQSNQNITRKYDPLTLTEKLLVISFLQEKGLFPRRSESENQISYNEFIGYILGEDSSRIKETYPKVNEIIYKRITKGQAHSKIENLKNIKQVFEKIGTEKESIRNILDRIDKYIREFVIIKNR